MLNIFRLFGDSLHFCAITILLHKIWKTKTCAGISGKSQVLFAIVYTARYLDLAISYISLYNTFMKLYFIIASYCSVYLIYKKFKKTYDHDQDTFCVEFLILPAFGLALLISYYTDVFEIMWTFSIYLESVAILPQIFLVYKTGDVQTTSLYMSCLGWYRALYMLNWVYRYYAENHYDPISSVSGTVQTTIYGLYFFYFYVVKRNCNGAQQTEDEGKAKKSTGISILQEQLMAQQDTEACKDKSILDV